MGTGLPFDDAEYAGVLRREFGMMTPENAMKFGPLRPTRHAFDFEAADALVDFAAAHDMAVRGHTLVWHNQLPEWLTDTSEAAWSREQLVEILEEHVATVVEHYRGKVVAWDVVNEAVEEDALRDNIWLRTIGPEYIAMAFEAAHEADPEALLFYNDYGAEGLGPKSDAVYALVEGLVEDGVPIHGVGFQMHVSTEWAPSAQDVAANMKRLADLGLEGHITEMDVRMPLPPTEEKLSQQARVYERMLNVCLDASNCSAFVTWGVTDRYSWIPDVFEGEGAALLFDEQYAPKPAYDALQNALGTGV